MYPTVSDFVAALDRAGELRRIKAPVSPVLEITRIADVVSKSPAPRPPSPSARATDPLHHHIGGPALLFESVQGSDIPVLINAFGSYRRIEMALGCEEGGVESIARRIASLVKPQPPRSLSEAIAKARQFLPLMRITPRRRRGRGLSQEVVLRGDQIDLTRLPLVRCWPMDGDLQALGYPDVNAGLAGLGSPSDPAAWARDHRGRYITLAGIHTIHADDRAQERPPSHNIGMYRVQLLGPRSMAMHWHVHHDGASHWRSWKRLGQPMPVAVSLGGESVLPYSATAPLPPGISELLMAGFLGGRGIELVRGVTVPIWVPANAEIVIEGMVSHEAGGIGYDPRAGEPLGPGAVFEGPFGDHTGFYSLPDRYPVLTVTAITMRSRPIYPTTVVGLPPQEDYFLGKATERLFLPLLRTLIHDVEDYDLPMFGAFHNCAAIRIRKAYPLHGRRVMHAIWGAGQMSWTKLIFIVDDDVDVHDTASVLRAAAELCHPIRDLELARGPLDILDHAAPFLGAGTKAGFDCTRKVPDEALGGPPVASPDQRRPPFSGPALQRVIGALLQVDGLLEATLPPALGGWLLVRARKTAPRVGERIARALTACVDRPPFVVVLSEEVSLADPVGALFHWCAHFDAGRDMVRLAEPQACAVMDATPKAKGDELVGLPVRDWPPMLTMSPEIRKKVRDRWDEYGLTGVARPED